MANEQNEVLEIFTRTRALLSGHFVLRSGMHSGHYFQCAQVCQQMDAVERLAELLLAKVRGAGIQFDTVLAPAMGGLVIGQEVARQAKARYIFAEKENNVLVLRRGFTLKPGERILIVEDVVTRGGRVIECLEIVRAAGGASSAVAMLVDRSAGSARFAIPALSLLELSFPTLLHRHGDKPIGATKVNQEKIATLDEGLLGHGQINNRHAVDFDDDHAWKYPIGER